MVDESTDISTNSHFIIYVKYCYKGIIKVCYLKLLQVEESNAITLYNVIINLFDKNDGASVMMGKNTGVATRIAQINPFLYITHCIAHILSLACGDAQEQVESVKVLKSVMKKVYLFLANQINDICWLSWYDAVKNICLFVEPLLDTIFETYSNATPKKKPPILKLYQKLCDWKIFADLKPTIEATLQKIQHEYLEGNPRLGYNLNGSLTKISSTSYPYIGNHKLTFNNGYEDDLMVDICEFASSIIIEIKERFPNPKLLSAMKILNPQEWPKDKESLMLYGLIDSVAVQEEWFGFKIVVHSNYQDLAIDDLFPLLYNNYLDTPLKLNLSRIAHSGDVQLSDEQNQILNLAEQQDMEQR
ncbi:9874_t:CDS:2 [Entrophospora sp. SA101]|nr:9874_t:CDS:2 [Entrophospora sp. SA101]